ncbi:MAG: tartrate dehydrogenase [Chloroflexi bacterium]|nr:tartrate dehydrogenase [Chloroflexota bacterium]
MQHYPIAVVPGDGIGVDVLEEGIKTLDFLGEITQSFRFEYQHFPWSCEYYLKHGTMMADDALDQLAHFPAIYFGACGFPALVPDHVSLWGMILPIRKHFQQYVNVRPIRLLPGLPGRLRDKGPEHIDFVCIRENTEGEYAGAGGRIHVGQPYEVAIQSIVFTRTAVERIIRYAFDYAVRTGRRQVTSVTKSNAMQYNMVFWDEVFRAVAKEYSLIRTTQYHVDAIAARFITNPETLDVIVASNLFADILTDLGGALQGSMGVPPSANIDPTRQHPSMFEPVHGSAPDIAGKGIANPIAAVWAGQMMLDFLGLEAEAKLLMAALEATTRDGRVLTPDLGGRATTGEVSEAIRDHLRHMTH